MKIKKTKLKVYVLTDTMGDFINSGEIFDVYETKEKAIAAAIKIVAENECDTTIERRQDDDVVGGITILEFKDVAFQIEERNVK